MMVFTGTANPRLAEEVVGHLGMELGRATVDRFSDGEVMIELLDNVRGKDVFVLQSTCMPTNDNLMEVMVMVDALRRASAGRITAAIPYLGYSRQDRRPRSARVAITAKVVANMLTSVGVNRVLTMDLHSDQIQGFFDIPVDNIYATPLLLSDLWRCNYENLVVVSPDVGGVVRARAAAKQIDCDLAIIDKRRPKPNVAKVMNIATKVVAYCTHPVLSGTAAERITNSNLDELVVTNTIPLRAEALACSKIRQLSAAELLAETIRRISNEDSVSTLFLD
ncbi:MAG: ribose-phosphate pyrophosphokinase [Pseudomonadota bacterium]